MESHPDLTGFPPPQRQCLTQHTKHVFLPSRPAALRRPAPDRCRPRRRGELLAILCAPQRRGNHPCIHAILGAIALRPVRPRGILRSASLLSGITRGGPRTRQRPLPFLHLAAAGRLPVVQFFPAGELPHGCRRRAAGRAPGCLAGLFLPDGDGSGRQLSRPLSSGWDDQEPLRQGPHQLRPLPALRAHGKKRPADHPRRLAVPALHRRRRLPRFRILAAFWPERPRRRLRPPVHPLAPHL